MALDVICSNGHSYVQSDIYKDWPEDWPVCPICLKNYLGNEFPAGLQGSLDSAIEDTELMKKRLQARKIEEERKRFSDTKFI